MAEWFGPSPWAFGGFMMAGILISLILTLFTPETKNLAYSRQAGDKIIKDIEKEHSNNQVLVSD